MQSEKKKSFQQNKLWWTVLIALDALSVILLRTIYPIKKGQLLIGYSEIDQIKTWIVFLVTWVAIFFVYSLLVKLIKNRFWGYYPSRIAAFSMAYYHCFFLIKGLTTRGDLYFAFLAFLAKSWEVDVTLLWLALFYFILKKIFILIKKLITRFNS